MSNNSGINSNEGGIYLNLPEELRSFYTKEKRAFPKWVLDLYNKPEWNTICNKIKEPIPKINSSDMEQYKNLLVNRQTCNIGMKVYDKRVDFKSEYESLWLQSLGLNEEEIKQWPKKPITSAAKNKYFREGTLPLNVMVMTRTPMEQERWGTTKKNVNVLNLVGYGFDSILQPDFQKFYLADMKIEEGRKLLLEGKFGSRYKNEVQSKEGSLAWDITPRDSTITLGAYEKGQFGYELIDLYITMYKKACNLAIVNGLEAIFFTGVGAGYFGPKGITEEQFNKSIRDVVFSKIIREKKVKIGDTDRNYFFRGEFKDSEGNRLMVFDKFKIDMHSVKEKDKPEPNYYLKGNKDKVFARNDLLKQILYGKYPDLKTKIDNLSANKVCYVNAWDPHSIAGNGNFLDNSLDGYFGAYSAISLLCWPHTNPVLAKKVEHVIKPGPFRSGPVPPTPFIPGTHNTPPEVPEKKPKGILKKDPIKLLRDIPDFNNFMNEHFEINTTFKFPEPESDGVYNKLKAYIEYCDIISEAYKNKHGEITKIYNLLKKIVENQPKTPSGDASIKNIIKYLDNVVSLEEIKMTKKSFKTRKAKQKKWMKQNEGIMTKIKDRVNKKLFIH